MKLDLENLKRLALTVRMLSVDGVEKANSGHPGLPLGAADYAAYLWAAELRFNPKDPHWPGRDRFVLSAGHGSMLLYSLLHIFGYELPMDQVKKFRQWESITPGHPEFGITPGVEATTGPLGQGCGNAVGMALSGKILADRYSKELFNYRVYALVSDGDMMEGVASEAASLAGHLGLSNLIYLYDDNLVSLAGDTKVCFTESVAKRFDAYNWFVQQVDGHDMKAFSECLAKAQAETQRPSMICCRTTLGFGSPNKANTHDVHGAPLGKDELLATRKNLGWPTDKDFFIPPEVAQFCCELMGEKQKTYDAWQSSFAAWRAKNSDAAKVFDMQVTKEVPAALKSDLIAHFSPGKKEATRNLSGEAIQICAKHLPGFIGGSADLEPSTKTSIKGGGEIQKGAYAGKNFRYGVREHGMGALANGLAYSGAWFPYTATFLVFSDYMRPSIRLAALSHIQTLFIFTHDSFWVGEDGPTHEPIEHVASLRLIPNLHVFRPADGLEVGMSYYAALELKKAPSTLLFTRQSMPPLERPANFNPDQILKGGYIVSGEDCKDRVIVASGSEVWVAQAAAKMLAQTGKQIRVVSMPCMELFLKQDAAYRESVIPSKAKKASLEAGVSATWERVIGSENTLKLGIEHYGASAPGELLADKFGFTPEKVCARLQSWI